MKLAEVSQHLACVPGDLQASKRRHSRYSSFSFSCNNLNHLIIVVERWNGDKEESYTLKQSDNERKKRRHDSWDEEYDKGKVSVTKGYMRTEGVTVG